MELFSLYLEFGELELDVHNDVAIPLENVMKHELSDDLPLGHPGHLVRWSLSICR